MLPHTGGRTTRRGSSAPTTPSPRSPARSARCSRSSAPRRSWLLAYPRRRGGRSARRQRGLSPAVERGDRARGRAAAAAAPLARDRPAARRRSSRSTASAAASSPRPSSPTCSRASTAPRPQTLAVALLRDRAPAGASPSRRAVRLAGRIGLLRTMVFTHLPSNLLLAAIAFAPNLRERDRAPARPLRCSRRWTCPPGRRTSSPSSTRASAPRPPPTPTPPAT